MKNPRALRHIVTLQQLVAGSPQFKPNGEPDAEWVDFLSSVSASVEPLRGRELYAAQEHHAEVDTRIRLRYRAGIDAVMRVAFGSQLFEILAVLDLQMRHVELELMCKLLPHEPAPELTALLLESGGFALAEDGAGINQE